MTVKKICVLGQNLTGVPISSVIANKCPEIKVTVVHNDPERVFLLNAKQAPMSSYAPGLADLIRKCQNKNLFFTTNDESAIKEADIIFTTCDSPLKVSGDGKNKAVDLTKVEESALCIAEYAESDKIVVESSGIPMHVAECVKNILKANCRPGVRFQVLSNPYKEDATIKNLISPDSVLIGCETSSEGAEAAKQLSSMYTRWIPPEKIITKDNWTVELAMIGTSAMVAQQIASLCAFSKLCERMNADVAEVIKILKELGKISSELPEPRFSLLNLTKVVSTLVYTTECMGLREVANYWRRVLEMSEHHVELVKSNIVSALGLSVSDKIVSILGFACHKDTSLTKGSIAVEISLHLLKNKAKLNICDPKVTKSQAVEDIYSSSCAISLESLNRAVSVFEDPYKALFRSEIMVLCAAWPVFLELDFSRIFAGMEKPAYIFDCENVLPHENLKKIGFKVFSMGKCIQNN